MSPSPRGGTMLILNIKILRKVNKHFKSAHKYNIYKYIINAETQRNLPKPLFPNFFATKPTQAQNELLRCCIFAS